MFTVIEYSNMHFDNRIIGIIMNTLFISKRSILLKLASIILFVFLLPACNLFKDPAKNISVIPLFSDNMVLQQKQSIPIFGKAEPGGEVIVELGNQRKSCIVDTSGAWNIKLDPILAGGPYTLLILGQDTLTIHNVMIGEVWLCSGQSNMEMPLAGSGKILNYEKEIANSNYPNIRLLTVEKKMENLPQNNFKSDGWKKCSPLTIPEFSAVAYFFGRKLHKELNVPIGLINASWGGTVVEAWTSGQSLKTIPEFSDLVNYIESDSRTDDEKLAAAKKVLNDWPDKIEQNLIERGTFDHGFQNFELNTDSWRTMKLPTIWEDAGLDFDGVVWFNKDVEIPASWKGEELLLSLGKINDFDITWFNGHRVGRGVDVADDRLYKVPSAIVKIGTNRITVQVLDIGNIGGLYGPANKMMLLKKEDSISLNGNWKYKIDPIKINVSNLPKKPTSNTGANRPTVLYNGMINPIVPYRIRGVIWYQGESNAERAYQYRTLFKTLIKDWRDTWDAKTLPFLFVQLANYKQKQSIPEDDSWAELREAQTMALDLPNTGMAVAIDIGDAKDIHPKNKQSVGMRLALNALAKVYNKDISFSGPMYKSMNISANRISIQFKYIANGLKTKGSKIPKGFAIAGKDKKFVWAESIIEGDEVIVWNSKIKNPIAVRYAWASNPICNLYNGDDLPALPFRTDDWQGITYGKK
jgi:sialate O-acetylesterase